MLASIVEEFDPALSAIYILSPGNFDCFAVDKDINYLFSGFLQVILESFPGNAHYIRDLVLLDMEEIAKADNLRLFMDKLIISRLQSGPSLGFNRWLLGSRIFYA
jgi:hypothetical protein